VAVLDGASLALSRAGERVVAAARTDLRHAVERLGRSRRSVAREARRQLVAADADLTAGRRRLVHETRAVLARAELMLSHDAGQLHASARQHARTEQRRVADAVRTLDERSRRALERAATEIDRDAARVSAAD